MRDDLLIVRELVGGRLEGRTIAWSGDANNVLASWVHAAARFDFGLKVATPKEHGPRPALRDPPRLRGRLPTRPPWVAHDHSSVRHFQLH